MQTPEILDLVNSNDEVIGTVDRIVAVKNGYYNIRTVNLFVMDESNNILVQRRSKYKASFPLGLDFSVGGYVISGESYLEAVIRESKEELGIKINEQDLICINQLNPTKQVNHNNQTISSFMSIYLLKCYRQNFSFTLDSQESSDLFWIKPTELLNLIEQENKIRPQKSDLTLVVNCLIDWIEKK